MSLGGWISVTAFHHVWWPNGLCVLCVSMSSQVGNEAPRCGWASEASEFPQARTTRILQWIGRVDLWWFLQTQDTQVCQGKISSSAMAWRDQQDRRWGGRSQGFGKEFREFCESIATPAVFALAFCAFFVATCTTGQYFQAVGSWVSQQRCSQTKWRQSNGNPRMDLFPDALQALKMTWSWLWDDVVSCHFDHLFVQFCCESFHWGKRLWWHWPGWLEYGGPWLDVGSCWSTRFECSNLRCVDCWKRWQRRP